MQYKYKKTIILSNFALVLPLIIVISSVFNYAQDEIIRINTDLVRVPATVLDRNGRYITNLKKEDFQIFEEGIEQEVALFESAEESFTVLLLLDRSGSMSGSYRVELTNAANVFVKQLRPDDQVMAATFANRVDLLFEATKVKDLQKGIKIKNLPGDNNTMIYDAVEVAFKKMKKIKGRKAIVLFSDGVGDEFFASAKENLREAEEQEAMIYTVQFDTFKSFSEQYGNKKWFRKGVETANNYMRDLAAKTGGRHFQIENIANLEQTFGEIANELGRQYNLGYYAKQLERGQKQLVRQIKVKVQQPNLVVRARNSYIVEPAKSNKK